MGIINFLPVLALSFFFATAPSANAQEEDSNLTRSYTYQDWLLSCAAPEGKEVCRLSQVIINKETKKPLARLMIRRLPNGTDVMIITLQLGVDLRKGAFIQITEDQFINNLTYTMCLADGCRLQFPLNPEIISAMGNTGEGRLIFGRPNNEQNIALPVSFAGFTTGYYAYIASIKSEN